MKTQLTKICFFFLMLILPLSFVAAASLSYIPRVYLAEYAGNNSNLLGKADILAPVYLTANNNLFIYAQGKYAYENETWEDNTYTGSLGVGYRQIVKDASVLGAYVFGDYAAATSGHEFWVVSPGIEGLTRNWDFRANGYFPLDKTRWVDAGWANEFGDYHYVEQTGHSIYDHFYQYYQETGIGGDAEIGRNLYMFKGIFKGILFKGFVNGYYFNMKHNDDVTGGGVRLTIQPNRSLKISLRDSYDNYEHNTFMAGIQLSFYDLFTDNRNDSVAVQDLQRNLFVPIERNLGTIGTGSSIPVTQSDNPEDISGRELLFRDNVWYFQSAPTASNSPGDGTYEHPYVGGEFNQTNVNNIYSYTTTHGFAKAYLYFSPGTYNAYTAGTPYLPIMLQPNQQMWGRMDGSKGFLEPATGTTRALFIGSLQLDTGDWLNNLRLQNDFSVTGFTEGVTMDGTANNGAITNVAINDVVIGANDSNTGYLTGIYMNNATIDNISNSDVYGYDAPTTDRDAAAFGVYMQSDSTLTIGDNNIISANAFGGTFGNVSTGSFDASAYAAGLEADDSTVTVSGSGNTISGNATGGTFGNVSGDADVSVTGWAEGLDADDSTVTVSGSGNTISGTATGGIVGNISNSSSFAVFPEAEGIYADDSTVTVSGSGNTILATATGRTVGNISSNAYVDMGLEIAGLRVASSSTVNLSGSGNTISGTGTGGTFGDLSNSADADAYLDVDGILAYDSTVNLSGSGNTISGTGTAGTTVGNMSTGAVASPYAEVRCLGVLGSSTLNLSGSGNTITAAATGGTTGTVDDTAEVYAYAEAEGLYGSDSTVNLIGNENTISAAATGGTVGIVVGTAFVDVSAEAKGLYGWEFSGSTTITLSGSGNNIYGTATAGSVPTAGVGAVTNYGEAYGISVEDGATLDIEDTATNTDITVNGSTDSWGIFADSGSFLKRTIGGVTNNITNGTDYDTWVTYTKLGTVGSGYALQWDKLGFTNKDW